MMKKIALIYMGGTFGCIGEPLSPMPAEQFIPQLQHLLPVHLSITCLTAPDIRDSSACTAGDWLQLLDQIQQLQLQQYQHFVIIHGTDTLSYASAVLSRFIGQSAHVVLTGSQYPLLNVQGTDSREFTDAIDNLNFALDSVIKAPAGVYLAFHHQLLHASTALKTHTTELNAFAGITVESELEPLGQPFIVNERHIAKARSFNCLSLMMQPVAPEQLLHNLQAIAARPPHALILQGFGTGNIAVNAEISTLLRELPQRGCAVIVTTQVPFGSMNQHYAVSQWMAEAKILLSNSRSHADLYAKALKMYLQYDDAEQWHLHWQD
jgi:L-asparaginase